MGRALELACGAGANAVWLASRGWEVTAVDYSPAALDRARALARARGVELRLVEADVTSYRADQPYDLVSLCYLHLAPERQGAALQAASAAVAPRGRLVFVGHDRSDDHFRATHDMAADRLTTPESVAAVLAADLSIERAAVVESRLHGGSELAQTTLVVARRRGTSESRDRPVAGKG